MIFNNLKFDLFFGQCNGSMTVNIFDKDILFSTLENQQGTVTILHNIIFPTTLKVVLSNKNTRTDTKIQDGKIVADKYVQLTNMVVGNIPIEISNLINLCVYDYDNQTTNNSYWSFNGIVTLDFNALDFLQWHLKHNNKFEI